ELGARVELDEPLPGIVFGVHAALGLEDAVGGRGLAPEGAAEDLGVVGGRSGGGGGDDGCGGRARALGNRDVDGCSGGTITTDEVGGLAEEGGEGLFLGVLAVPDGPFGTGGVG